MSNYIRPTSLDHPAVGNLMAAREGRKHAFKHLRNLRERLRNEPMSGDRGGLRLQIIRAQQSVSEWRKVERGALEMLERRANELGKTTRRSAA